jgi:hypothetical protein
MGKGRKGFVHVFFYGPAYRIIMVLSFIVKDKSTCFLSLKYHVTFYALLLNDVKCQHNAWSHQSS